MDGNGRWAQARGLARTAGHVEGVKSVRACTEQAVRRGIRYLSIFAFSEENWGRPSDEVGSLMELMGSEVEREVSLFMENDIRFLVLGNKDRLPMPLRLAIEGLETATASHTTLTLIVFLSYSGRWDISQAAVRMAEAGDTDISKYLITAGIPDPDLLIRTSGEQRISNYLLWQTAYTEFYFTDTLWPDFREKEFDLALDAFVQRDRRYGKVK